MSRDKVLARDKFGNQILLIKYPGRDDYDLMTDGRVFLDKRLARTLSMELEEFANRLAKPPTKSPRVIK